MTPKSHQRPPPAVGSSEDTAPGSGTDESEEEIALSPPSVTPKYASTQQKVQQPESSDEEEEDEEEEEEEEEEDEEDGEEEEETKLTPPPPSKREESESDEEEEEEEEEDETDDEGPLPVHPPQQEVVGNGEISPLPTEDEKLSKLIQRSETPVNGAAPRDFDVISQMYPFLAEEIKKAEKKYPGLYERQYKITDEEAREMDQKIKNQRISEIKVDLLRNEVFGEVTKTLMGLIK